MHALKARVENGRLKLDEPTDLPDGQTVELAPIAEVLALGGDNLDDEERAALHQALQPSLPAEMNPLLGAAPEEGGSRCPSESDRAAQPDWSPSYEEEGRGGSYGS